MPTDRNLHPHAQAMLAMNLFGREYSSQSGGCMDFWDALDDRRKDHVRELVAAVRRLPLEDA